MTQPLSHTPDKSFWLLAAAIFAILTAVNYAPVFSGKVPFPKNIVLQFPPWADFPNPDRGAPVAEIGDLVTYFYPFHAVGARAIRSGTLPLWNPDIMTGEPFQANPQSAIFYPLNVFFYLLPLPTAWAVSIMVRMFLAGMFTVLLARYLGSTNAGSLVAGIVFAYCGFMTAWQGQPMSDGAMWLPLVLYAVLRLRRSGSLKCVAFAAAAFAMPVLAGHPEQAAHVTLIGCISALFVWIFPMDKDCRPLDWRFIASFTLVGVIALGLAAVQLGPALQWISESGRSLDTIWPSLKIHQMHGILSRDIFHNPNSVEVMIPEAAAYAGMFTLLAASLAIFHRNRRAVILVAGLTLACFATAYGIKPFHWITTQLPVLKGLKNWRLILMGDLGIGLLAGLSVSVLEQDFSAIKRLQRTLMGAVLGLAFLVCLIGVTKLKLATNFRTDFLYRASFSRGLLIAGLILMAWRLSGHLSGRRFAVLACALAAFDLGTFAYGYTGFARPDQIFPSAPVFDFLKAQGPSAEFRVAQAGNPYPANAGMIYGIASADGYEPNVLRHIKEFSAGIDPGNWDELVFETDKVVSVSDRRLDMLNLKYLMAYVPSPEMEKLTAHPERFLLVFNKGQTAVFENKNAMPRAWLVPAGGIERIESDGSQLNRIKEPEFDPQRKVVLTEVPAGLQTAVDPSSNLDPVSITSSNQNGYEFSTHSKTAAILVVSQSFYPGWRATVNGVATSVYRADYALTGLPVPAGDARVRLVFDPMLFKVCLGISAVFLVLLVAAMALRPGMDKLSERGPMG